MESIPGLFQRLQSRAQEEIDNKGEMAGEEWEEGDRWKNDFGLRGWLEFGTETLL